MKVFFTLLLVCCSSLGATYYVDQSAGNDAGLGTSGSPWKNCPGMYNNGVAMHTGSGVLAAGDTVYLDSGDTWQVSNHVGGSGGGFILVAGVHYIGNQWPDAITSRPWPAQYGAKIQANGFCAAGLTRINADHASIPTWYEGFENDGNNQSCNLFDINHGFWVTGLYKADKIVDNCYMHDGEGDGSTNAYTYGIVVSDGSSDASGWVANVKVVNTRIYKPSRDALCWYPGASGIVSNCWATNCLVSGLKNDDSYSEGHGYMAKGLVKDSGFVWCIASNVNSSAIFINGPETGSSPGPTNLIVANCILETQDNNGVIRFYGTGNKTVTIRNTIVKNNETTGTIGMQGNSGTIAAKIYNNILLGFMDLGNPTSTGTIELRNNLIYEVDDMCLVDAGTDVTTHDHNVYYKSAGGNLVTSGASTYTAANIATYEATAITANPNFVSITDLPNSFLGNIVTGLYPDATGLTLQGGSPAIDVAASLTFTDTIDGRVTRSQGFGWDIGAYEYSSQSLPSRMGVRQVRVTR